MEMVTNLRTEGNLVVRFNTGIKSGDSVFTDLSGHTVQQHRFKSKLTTGVR